VLLAQEKKRAADTAYGEGEKKKKKKVRFHVCVLVVRVGSPCGPGAWVVVHCADSDVC
jgi:hypothetical protein